VFVENNRSNPILVLTGQECGATDGLTLIDSGEIGGRNASQLGALITNASNETSTTERHKALSLFPSQLSEFKVHLPALDGLRGVAILAVLFFHYAGGTPKQSHSFFIDSISMVISFGWTGVDLFFVLSGFLITGILYDTRNSTRYYRNFYARRILRIFPAYYLMLTIYLLLTPYLHLHWKPAHLFFLAYLGYPAALVWTDLQIISPFIVVDHLWSLSAEEQFYFAWPWMIAKLKSREAILLACAALSGGAILLRTAILASHRLDPSWAYGFLPCRMDSLALGASLAVLVRSPWYGLWQKWAAPGLITAIGVLLIICETRHSVDRYDPVIATIGYSVIAIAYGALLLGSLRERGWLEHVFSSRLLRLFGKYSYGLYLYHLPLAAVLNPLKVYLIAETHSFLTGRAIYLASAFVINLMIAVLSFHLFESPILRFKSHFQS
jgi:peptidoglycan/LPS O-acetylase OafA/YrhL